MSKFRRSGSFTLSPPKKNFPAPAFNNTPGSRRQSFTTPTNALIILEGTGNNDEEEKRKRQLNRLQQLQSRGIHSPSGSVDRRKSINNFANLTSQQITEHYSKCIQLSAENKINIKNAFNLQLIDYMTELLRRKDSEMNNFQVASCTLDASTKIYGYRVDCVHTDTLKMAGGLGRTKEQGEGEGAELAEGDVDPKEKKKVKKKKCVTVETNIKSLNVAHFDLEFDVDPLFKKTASQFDEGRAGGGQFMNTLQMPEDSCQLILDSDTVLDCQQDTDEEKDEPQTVSLPPITDASKLISPTFSSFEFTSWKLGEEESRLGNLNGDQNEHAFDMNAVPDPLEELDHFDNEDVNEELPYEDETGLSNKTVITLGGGACRQEPCPPPQLEIVHLKDHLADAPLEYSYFDTRVMSAWAGPGHWKLKPLNKGLSGNKPKERQKKELTLIYDEDLDEIERHIIAGKKTKLSQATVKKWNTHNTTLPMDLHYDPSKLRQLYMRPSIVIRRQINETEIKEESTTENNCQNNDHNDVFGDVSSNYGDNTAAGYDDTDIFSQTVAPSQGHQDQDEKTKDFLGENLVEAPNKVSLINIGYARTAKKIDMKKLKSNIWLMLADPENNKENERNHNIEVDSKTWRQKQFASLYSDLGPRLPSKMNENLSVALAFIALLHLANEHCLKLVSCEELGDFFISQG